MYDLDLYFILMRHSQVTSIILNLGYAIVREKEDELRESALREMNKRIFYLTYSILFTPSEKMLKILIDILPSDQTIYNIDLYFISGS